MHRESVWTGEGYLYREEGEELGDEGEGKGDVCMMAAKT